MTFDEFKELAQNPIQKEQETIFVLSRTVIDKLPEKKRQHYPEYEIIPDYQSGYFHTLEEAEITMRKQVDKVKKSVEGETFCYEILERPMGEMSYKCTIVSHRIYDVNGLFLEQTLCASGCFTHADYIYGIFRGRTEAQMRFKPGDIVEFVHGDKVKLGYVAYQPLSIEDCWRMQQKHITTHQKYVEAMGEDYDVNEDMPEYFGSDDSDDSYIVLTTSNYISHHHVHITRIFAPHFPIPNYMRKKLERAYQKFIEKGNQA